MLTYINTNIQRYNYTKTKDTKTNVSIVRICKDTTRLLFLFSLSMLFDCWLRFFAFGPEKNCRLWRKFKGFVWKSSVCLFLWKSPSGLSNMCCLKLVHEKVFVWKASTSFRKMRSFEFPLKSFAPLCIRNLDIGKTTFDIEKPD